jgi:hypothetical protein
MAKQAAQTAAAGGRGTGAPAGGGSSGAAQAAQQTALARAGQQNGPGGQIAKLQQLDYQIVRMLDDPASGGDIKVALDENLGGADVSAFDFSRVKVPAGGGLAWTIADQTTGDEFAETSFEGIIVAWKDQKAFWKQSLNESGARRGPPDCYSPDMKKGIGDPGVPCAGCKFNVFGSAKGGQGRGKACKDTRQIFFMRSESVLPELLIIPPTSLAGVKSYMMKLAARAIPFWNCVTRFKLVKDKNAEGTEYSKVELQFVAALDGTPKQAAMQYSGLIRKMLGHKTILPTQADLEGEEIGGYDQQAVNNAAAVAMQDATAENTAPDVSGGTPPAADNDDWTQEAAEGT